MHYRANTTFAVKRWDEQSFLHYAEGRKLTRARVTHLYAGDLEGEGQVEYLLAYTVNGIGQAVALERVTGKLAGRSGSFVIQHTTTFAAHTVRDYWSVVPGSGTDDLRALSGGGAFELSGPGPYPISFDFSLE